MFLISFFTSEKDQLAKIYRHCWKERLKFSKLSAKFESDMSETIRDIGPQNRDRRLYG